jgi:hypothetical protein
MICREYMYRVISHKTLCCDINEDLLPPVYGRLFYHGASPLCYLCSIFVVLCRDVVIFLVWSRLMKVC